MIKKRPSLPTGHSVAGLPPIEKALYSDRRCEIYCLAGPAGETQLLFLQHFDGDPSRARRLVDWWGTQPPHVLRVLRVLPAEEFSSHAIAAALTVRGRHLEFKDLHEAKEDALKLLLFAMLDLVGRGSSMRMYPDFDPPLTWLSSDSSAVCTLLPLDGVFPAEADQVRLVAKAFYRFATGIASEQVAGGVPTLLQWSKYGGEELSRIIDRCLAPDKAKARIGTFSALNSALGRKKEEGQDHESSSSVAPDVPSSAATGLAKVAGMHSLKALLRREVVEPIRNPEPYKRYGLSIPNGILLYGPPGCGKTYIARQLAEELGHYFVEIIPSELASPYVHQSVVRIRGLFDAAAEQAPAVMFIDEFEALVPERAELGGHQQHKAEEVNEFLAHLGGCSAKGIFVIAATNQPERIDPAVRRTGRLDKLIYVGPPDAEARREMLALHLEGRPVAAAFDLERLANGLEGYSASDIRFLVDEAAREALREGQQIGSEAFRLAIAKVNPSVTPEIEAQYRSIEQRGF